MILADICTQWAFKSQLDLDWEASRPNTHKSIARDPSEEQERKLQKPFNLYTIHVLCTKGRLSRCVGCLIFKLCEKVEPGLNSLLVEWIFALSSYLGGYLNECLNYSFFNIWVFFLIMHFNEYLLFLTSCLGGFHCYWWSQGVKILEAKRQM